MDMFPQFKANQARNLLTHTKIIQKYSIFLVWSVTPRLIIPMICRLRTIIYEHLIVLRFSAKKEVTDKSSSVCVHIFECATEVVRANMLGTVLWIKYIAPFPLFD